MYNRVGIAMRAIDHDIRNLPIVRRSLFMQITESLQGVCDLKQRAVAVMASSFEQLPRWYIEINDGSVFPQFLAIIGGQDNSTSRRQHDVAQPNELSEHKGLPPTETLFTLDLEDRRYADARSSLNLVVGINKSPTQAPRKSFANRRLAGPHQADQKDVFRFSAHHGILSHRKRRRPATPAFVVKTRRN